MPLLVVLVALSMFAMTGGLGLRGGAYRKRGIVVGLVLVAVAMALFLTNRVQ